MAWDPKCNELAAYFLPPEASEAERASLSQHIQDKVEEWLIDNGYGPDAEEIPDEVQE
jgi:hypothetical protein